MGESDRPLDPGDDEWLLADGMGSGTHGGFDATPPGVTFGGVKGHLRAADGVLMAPFPR